MWDSFPFICMFFNFFHQCHSFQCTDLAPHWLNLFWSILFFLCYYTWDCWLFSFLISFLVHRNATSKKSTFTEIQFTRHTLHRFKVYKSMTFSVFTDFCNITILGHFITLKRNPAPVSHRPLIPLISSPVLGTP